MRCIPDDESLSKLSEFFIALTNGIPLIYLIIPPYSEYFLVGLRTLADLMMELRNQCFYVASPSPNIVADDLVASVGDFVYGPCLAPNLG